MIPYGRQSIDAADIGAVVEVLKSNFLTQGPMGTRFERGEELDRGNAQRRGGQVPQPMAPRHLAQSLRYVDHLALAPLAGFLAPFGRVFDVRCSANAFHLEGRTRTLNTLEKASGQFTPRQRPAEHRTPNTENHASD